MSAKRRVLYMTTSREAAVCNNLAKHIEHPLVMTAFTPHTHVKRTLILVEAIETLQSEFSIITALVLQQLVDSGDEVASCEDAAGGGIGRNRT